MEWTEEDHKQIERFTRYRITAERSFARAFNNVEQVRKYWRGGEQPIEEPDESAVPESPDEEPESETEVQPIQEPEPRFFHVLEQWVDVVIENGRTVTKLEPSNEQLLADLKAIKPPAEQVCRRFHFCDGVPDEYSWCFGTEKHDEGREYGLQRMTIDTWLAAIKREKSGHLTDTGQDQPEPRKGLWCYCEFCRRYIGISERRWKESEAEEAAQAKTRIN